MRLISVLKCHAAALVLRASPLNWALCLLEIQRLKVLRL
uniref:Uncharacterized protein n=1 Tax=Vibrio vulnificus TaxID=672 RepID=A0A6S4Q0U7_VIBVL|nr:hypothetical protein [Vibrio vulnificus]